MGVLITRALRFVVHIRALCPPDFVKLPVAKQSLGLPKAPWVRGRCVKDSSSVDLLASPKMIYLSIYLSICLLLACFSLHICIYVYIYMYAYVAYFHIYMQTCILVGCLASQRLSGLARALGKVTRPGKALMGSHENPEDPVVDPQFGIRIAPLEPTRTHLQDKRPYFRSLEDPLKEGKGPYWGLTGNALAARHGIRQLRLRQWSECLACIAAPDRRAVSP